MSQIEQNPAPGSQLLKWVGDSLTIEATYSRTGRPGRMILRTNLGAAATHRVEILNALNNHLQPSGDDWHDVPMQPCGNGRWLVELPLLEVGLFEAKVCFLPNDTPVPEWPDGANLNIKVAPANTAAGNLIYAAFTRQFGARMYSAKAETPNIDAVHELDNQGYTVIPPSGTFRNLIKQLDHIFLRLGFRNLLLLPIHPTPTTFARMGRYGSPFAGRDFLDIDPALAEFDTKATPLDQFHELIAAVHARGGALFMDLPANHTGWAATFQIHHPEWYRKNPDGSFHSPGAWGVTWEDLVELDYSKPALCRAIANVFLYWCRQGVDGFRCDAGYMIPKTAWDVIVAHVRQEFPDTIFLLEGLGGPIETTSALLARSGLDWAYSELFQTYDRTAFEHMFPSMLQLSQQQGPLVHFAETHDNNRLAATSPTYARLRIALAALLSQQGAFGITAGVEWFATEKIDVHECGGLNWGAADNACDWIRLLNTLLRTHPLFGADTSLEMIQHGGGNVLAVLRKRPNVAHPLLVLANLDWAHAQTVAFPADAFPPGEGTDLLTGETLPVSPTGMVLTPGQVRCLTPEHRAWETLLAAMHQSGITPIAEVQHRARRVLALRTLHWLGGSLHGRAPEAITRAFLEDPVAFAEAEGAGGPRLMRMSLPEDFNREVPVPPGMLLMISAAAPFRVRLRSAQDQTVRATGEAIALPNGSYLTILQLHTHAETERLEALIELFLPSGSILRQTTIWALGDSRSMGTVTCAFPANEVSRLGTARTLLTNGTGAMAQIRLAWGTLRSQYDCLLALNRHPEVPDDRQVFFTRCRGWILCNGFSTPLSNDCLDTVIVSPDGSAAEWRFHVPCGMGRRVPITLRVALQPGENRVLLRFQRETQTTSEGRPSPAHSVGLILRPDIEWRNFHCKTKAYTGPEKIWPNALEDLPEGFAFTPEPDTRMEVRMEGADWHRESVWSYNVPHPEEQARGQEPAGDLWSPGWFHTELLPGDTRTLIAGVPAAVLPKLPAFTGNLDAAPKPLDVAMTQALTNYIVRRNAHKTVIAGYPWFLDWGRDTLIFLRGVAAAHDWNTVLDVLREFGRFEKGGTIPNMIRGEDDANRETVDAPLWLAVVVDDAIRALGAKCVLSLSCGGKRTLRSVLVSIAEHYIKGTVNGIHADPKTGLIWAPAHYTWMDTNYPAGTPRVGYAVEVQALWVRLLDLLGREVAPKWARLAATVRRAFTRLFPLPEGGLADCLCAAPGTGAEEAEPDDAIRPNQLYAITLGLLNEEPKLCASILNVTECLLLPGAIRTLANHPVRKLLPIVWNGTLLNDPRNPYWGRYEGDEDTRRKPAYHNGTGWTFPFPLYAEALFMTYGEPMRLAATSLLNSATHLINQDCVTQLPECVQGDAPHEPCGTGAQAWGASELLRVTVYLRDAPAPAPSKAKTHADDLPLSFS